MSEMDKSSKEVLKTWRCPKCHLETTDYPALTRRNVGYKENSEICSNCGELEALVDYADDITPMIHWEFSFFQMCCGNATQDGHTEFYKFLAHRKIIGKHDPPLWKIEWLIWEKMFPNSIKSDFLKSFKKHYIEVEAKWTEKADSTTLHTMNYHADKSFPRKESEARGSEV